MPVEGWIALVFGLTTLVGAILAATWKLSGQFNAAIAEFKTVDSSRASDIHRLNVAVEKIEVAVSAIAIDRERATSLERRVSKLEQWYDELRRGVGEIRPAGSRT